MSSRPFPILLILGLIVIGLSPLGLCAEEALPRQHLEITGSHTLRITYDCSFTWPSGGGTSAVFHLPLPPDTGTQRIDHFSSSLKGEIQTNDAVPPQRLVTATLRHDRGDEPLGHLRIQVSGRVRTRQLGARAPRPPPGPNPAPEHGVVPRAPQAN